MTTRTRKTKAKLTTRRSARTETAAKSTKAIGSSGLEEFAVHVGDTKREATASMRELRDVTATAQARTRNVNLLPTKQLDPETDIFGVMIGNWGKPLGDWTWQIGEGCEGPGKALRNLRDPTLHDQPRHMRDFEKSTPPYTYEHNDCGHVHDNSGIYNYAAFRIMTATASGKYLFTPAELAAMFYIAVTIQLSRTSEFTDSRRAVLQAARSLFRTESESKRNAKTAAVERGFDSAGIT